nr:reverse transcriptase domain-containing protein [Tanacetum cinerariifolium]
ARESSVAAAARPIKGRRAYYGFVNSIEAEIRRRRAEDIGYGIKDTWIDPRDVAEEEALTTLKGSTLGQTEIFQRVEALVDDAPSTTTTTVTNAQLQAMIDQGVNDALTARNANRTGDDSHTSGTGVRRTERWFERMETVFRISNCLVENQVKFATCTLLAGALTWWNSHVRIVGSDAAYLMTWMELKKKMADKYCLRNEMKKIESKFWNL